jgi:aldose 1-epimerase
MDYGPMRLDVETDALGLQVYEGAHLNTAQAATHSGVAYGSNAGLAIEPQAWPDAPNHPGYPDTRLKPGETDRQVSRFHAYARS